MELQSLTKIHGVGEDLPTELTQLMSYLSFQEANLAGGNRHGQNPSHNLGWIEGVTHSFLNGIYIYISKKLSMGFLYTFAGFQPSAVEPLGFRQNCWKRVKQYSYQLVTSWR